MTDREAEVAQAVSLYVIELRMWLSNQGHSEVIEFNPFIGDWHLSDGAGVWRVTEDRFTWYREAPGSGADNYHGTYLLLPGVLTNQGFVLNRGTATTDCYSMIQHYTLDTVNQVSSSADRHGVFFIEQMGDRNRLFILNQRTGGRFTATRRLFQ